ncbi:MAG TPA: hypothetical protein VNE82_14830 [Candidatus Binataceae bacterium]|nr:hypothetical protein [Candidatus Binataceae bacterium]
MLVPEPTPLAGEQDYALLNIAGVAQRLGRSRAWFYQHRSELEAVGFPRSIPVVRRWDPAAIDRWLEQQDKNSRAATKHDARSRLDAAFGHADRRSEISKSAA